MTRRRTPTIRPPRGAATLRGAVLSSGLVAVTLASRTAVALAEVPVSLAWHAPALAACPRSSAVLDQVQALVGLATNDGPRQSIEAVANVRQVSTERWHLDLTTHVGGVEGHRTLDAGSCQATADATALILAWMVDPNAMAARSTAEVRPPPPHAPPPPTELVVAPAPRDSAPPAPSGRRPLTIGLATSIDDGTLPRPALGFGGSLGLDLTSFLALSIHAAYWPASTGTTADPAVGGRFSLFAAGAALCAGPRLVVALCAGAEADRMRGEGFGVRADGSGSAWWPSLLAGGQARFVVVDRLHVSAQLSATLPSERHLFALDGVGPVHRPAALAVRGLLGLEAAF